MRMTLRLTLALVLAASCKPRGDVARVAEDEAAGVGDPFFREGAYIWDYDAGPDVDPGEGPQNSMGKELIDLQARIPYFPGLSLAIYGDQMFRPAFGPIPWRMPQKPNSVKILFIGQDGTHIAEAANRPATAGFGGRAQDLAKYFGVGPSAAFINAYAFTIRWQYGAFDNPYINYQSGTPVLSHGTFVGNSVWLISQDQASPLVKWRNDLISWIIRNNRESLQMIVLFGGASRDSMASWVISKGGAVGTRFTKDELAQIKIPEFDLTGAGSNKQTVFPLTRDGKDLYRQFNNGQTPNYTDPGAVKTLQAKFKAAFNQSPNTWLSKMVLPGDVNGDGKVDANEPKVGLNGSGMLHEAQLGGFHIDDKMAIDGQKTISLKGLRVSDDFTIDRDILVTQLPHPTALSMMDGAAAATAVKEGLTAFLPYAQQGWQVAPDPGFANTFARHAQDPNNQEHWYKYARGDMGTHYYDFGAPNSRMVNVSSASRSGKDVIVFGTRDKPQFDQNELKAMQLRKPASLPPATEQWIGRTTSPERRYVFDPGPGAAFAKIMKSSLPQDPAFVKAREVNGDFGHYRGTFKSPRVVVIADPHGFDDLITARALTGSRGQYLHSLLAAAGVGDQYLVIKTAPYAQDALWDDTVEKTKGYRDALLPRVFDGNSPALVITDGPAATAEFARVMGAWPAGKKIEIKRPTAAPDAGIADAVAQVSQTFPSAAFDGKMADLPRSHLVYYARVWEGTSGDRVIGAKGQFAGKAFGVVAPQWAYKQEFTMPQADVEGCKGLIKKLNDGKLRMGLERMSSYMARLGSNTPGSASQCGGGAAGGDGEGASAVAGTSQDQDGEVTPVELNEQPTEDKNFHLPFDDDWRRPSAGESVSALESASN